MYDVGPNFADRQLTWLDRHGHAVGTVGESAIYSGAAGQGQTLRLLPDRSEVAAVITQTTHIWLMETARGVSSRLTSSQPQDTFPVWSPNGNRIVFASEVTGTLEIYQKASDGTGNEELLVSSKLRKIPTSSSQDGRFVLPGRGPKDG